MTAWTSIAVRAGREVLSGAHPVPAVPRRDPHDVHPDHHLQRHVRQKDRQHPGRPHVTANRSRRARTRCSGRDVSGALASLNSVRKTELHLLPATAFPTRSPSRRAHWARPRTQQVNNLVSIMGGYFAQSAHHLNVNVLNREALMDGLRSIRSSTRTLTIRVSGYAVNFYKLSREQQLRGYLAYVPRSDLKPLRGTITPSRPHSGRGRADAARAAVLFRGKAAEQYIWGAQSILQERKRRK